MADIKISELGAASAVNATDLFPMTSSGVTVKATAQQIKNYIGVGNIADLDTTDKSSAVAAINEVNTKLSKTEVLTSNIQQSIATIQTTFTASKNYAVGEQFVYNGLLYKATTTIAQGGTITIGSNCALADNVTEQIRNANKPTSVPFTPVYGVTVIYNKTYKRQDGLMFILIKLQANVSLKTRTNLGQFDNVWLSQDISIQGVGQSIVQGTADSVITGYINQSGYIYMGDYISHSDGYREVTIMQSFYVS